MKSVLVLAIALSFLSCDKFYTEKVDKAAIVNEVMDTFNYNELDAYPAFSSCGSGASLNEQKACFEKTLTQYVYNGFNASEMVAEKAVNDTVYLDLEISKKGIISIVDTEMSNTIQELFPNLNAVLEAGIKQVPKVYPGIKRGQQVTVHFKLPIAIITE